MDVAVVKPGIFCVHKDSTTPVLSEKGVESTNTIKFWSLVKIEVMGLSGNVAVIKP